MPKGYPTGVKPLRGGNQSRYCVRKRQRNEPRKPVMLEAYDSVSGDILARLSFDIGYARGEREAKIFRDRYRRVREFKERCK